MVSAAVFSRKGGRPKKRHDPRSPFDNAFRFDHIGILISHVQPALRRTARAQWTAKKVDCLRPIVRPIVRPLVTPDDLLGALTQRNRLCFLCENDQIWRKTVM